MTSTLTDADILQLASKAIESALHNSWKEAISCNVLILKTDKKNINALNRLGFAYLQTGNTDEAKKCFEKVLAIDKYNSIAQRNLSKAESYAKKPGSSNEYKKLPSPMNFLEHPGETKMVQCIHTAPMQILASLSCGQEVFLKPKNHCVEIRDDSNTYIAALPDDISFRLLKLMAANNKYTVFIKNITKNQLTVFIREIERGKKFANQPTFGVNLASSFSVLSRPADGADTDTGDMPVPSPEDEDA